MESRVEEIDAEKEDFEILKVHNIECYGTVSLCYGSVEYEGMAFKSLYIVESSGTVWLWNFNTWRESSYPDDSVEYRMKLISSILLKTDDPLFGIDGAIPVELVTDGMPTVAAYLFAVENRSLNDIANKLEFSEVDTVRKYLRRYRKGENVE